MLPILLFVGCKTNSSVNESDVLVASDPARAMGAISSDQDFCVPTEEEGAHTCEKVILDFMNSPNNKGKELIITCAGGTVAIGFDEKKGGGLPVDPELIRLVTNIARQKSNMNRIENQNCTRGVRDI
jgi:hypothetical protein